MLRWTFVRCFELWMSIHTSRLIVYEYFQHFIWRINSLSTCIESFGENFKRSLSFTYLQYNPYEIIQPCKKCILSYNRRLRQHQFFRRQNHPAKHSFTSQRNNNDTPLSPNEKQKGSFWPKEA